jgi:thiamine-monophosphate kinase
VLLQESVELVTDQRLDAAADTRTVGQLGEDALVASVLARYGPLPASVKVGPGDDAAVLDVTGPVVLSTDTVVEGHDFRREWSSAADVGVKVAAQNLADVAAMGALPVALLVSLAADPDLPAGWARQLADGLNDECRRAGAAVIGGDVSEAAQIVITGTAIGVLRGRAVRRSGARPGDVVALAGHTGASAAGWALLRSGREGTPDAGGRLAELVTAHRAPRPPYAAGPQAAAAGATAMIDTSDGLVRDAGRIATASGVVLDLDADVLRPTVDLMRAAAAAGDPELAQRWVLTGGEDHALLACFPPSAQLPPAFRVIGQVLAAARGDAPVRVGGRPWTGPAGWRHFG